MIVEGEATMTRRRNERRKMRGKRGDPGWKKPLALMAERKNPRPRGEKGKPIFVVRAGAMVDAATPASVCYATCEMGGRRSGGSGDRGRGEGSSSGATRGAQTATRWNATDCLGLAG